MKTPFIVIDGIDSVGKATQTRLLVSALVARGRACEQFAFPQYELTEFGKLIHECLHGKHGDFVALDGLIASVPYAADRSHAAPAIRSALGAGKIVVSDRGASSNQIHQGGKFTDNEERIEFLRRLYELEHGKGGFQNPVPDIVVFLDASVEKAAELAEKRVAAGGERDGETTDVYESNRSYMEQCYATARWLADRDPSWRIIRCLQDDGEMRLREDIHADIMAVVEPFL